MGGFSSVEKAGVAPEAQTGCETFRVGSQTHSGIFKALARAGVLTEIHRVRQAHARHHARLYPADTRLRQDISGELV